MPHKLSGGQQQRVALARALAPQPDVLLLDEPFSNLDSALRAEVRQEVRDLLKQSGATAIFVTHDQEEALDIGDKVAVMMDGRLQQLDTPEGIFHRPHTRLVAEFIGNTDFVHGVIDTNGIKTSLGNLAQRCDLPYGTEVEVAVRADDVQVEAIGTNGKTEKPNGKILARQFVGIANIYRVELPDGTIVHSWVDHTIHLPIGTDVRVRLGHDHVLACFHNGQLVTLRQT